MEQGIVWEENLADVCGLAYLNYLTKLRELTEEQRLRAERMTRDFIQRRMRFGFMKKLMDRLGQPYLLEDKIFVEYRGNPGHKVVVHYCIETPREKNVSYVAERLYPVEPGIFVKEFTLFFGERLTWFLTETKDDGEELSSQDSSYTEDREETIVTGSKYAVVYEMARAMDERDMPLLDALLLEYEKKQFLVESLFTLK